MIKSLTLENFKCFGQKTTIPFAPITLIFGQNSAGKSSILQALYLLKQTAEHAPRGTPLLFRCAGGLVDLGNYRAIIHDHDETKRLEIGLSVTPCSSPDDETPIDASLASERTGASVQCNFQFHLAGSSPALAKLTTTAGTRITECIPREKGTTRLQATAPSAAFDEAYKYLFQHREGMPEKIQLAILRDTLLEVDPSGEQYWALLDEELSKHPVCEWLTGEGNSFDLVVPDEKRNLSAHRIARALEEALPDERSLAREKEMPEEQYANLLAAHKSSLKSLISLPQYQPVVARHQAKWGASLALYSSEFSPEDFAKALGVPPGHEYVFHRLNANALDESNKILETHVSLAIARVFLRAPIATRHEGVPVGPNKYEDYEWMEPWRLSSDELNEYDFWRAGIDTPSQMLAKEVNSCTQSGVSNLKMLRPLAPVRRAPERIHLDSGVRPNTVGFEGEWLIEVLLASQATLEASNSWLNRLTGYSLSVRALGGYDAYALQLADKIRGEAVEMTAADVGYGISQILPLIVESVAAREATITVEQPEVHLHPRLQAELGDLLAESAKQRSNQFIIETHSEHLMLRIQKLIRTGKLKPSDVAVLYVSRGDDGSNVQQLRLDEGGEFLDPWPAGFFPERLQEILG